MAKVTINPDAGAIADAFQVHFKLGLEALQKGVVEEAIKEFEETLKINPLSSASMVNIAVIHLSKGDSIKARLLLEKAINIEPPLPEAFLNLGAVLKSQGDLDGAILNYNRALLVKPDYAEALGNIGSVLRDKGDLAKALTYFKKALKIKPDMPDFIYNLGNVYGELGKSKMAEEYYQMALEKNPDYFNAYYNLGIIYQDRGELEKAARSYFSCLNLNPFYDDCWGNLVVTLQAMCRWDLLAKASERIMELTRAALNAKRRPGELPFFTITGRDDPKYALKLAHAWSEEVQVRVGGLPKFKFDTKLKSKSGKIRLGFISDGFRNFPTSQNLLGVLEKIDRKRFEIILYSYGINDKSNLRLRAQTIAGNFFDLSKINFIEAANKIYKDKIDILIDLKGYTNGNRIKIMATRPAPVIVSFLGFAGTTGSKFVDYIIADKVVIPEKDKKYYSEKVIYLPDTYWPTDNRFKISDTRYKRENLNIPKGAFIFASFNQPYKITSEIFETWLSILKRVPKSALVLWNYSAEAKNNLMERVRVSQVEKDRIIFAPTLPKDKHIKRLADTVDLALDTNIVNGHTTTTDALWAGVPVVTVTGAHFASRVSSSILLAAGLPELITHNLKQYEDLAIKLATNPKKLKAVKDKLSKNKLTEALFDTEKYTRNLEKVFEKIWNSRPKN